MTNTRRMHSRTHVRGMTTQPPKPVPAMFCRTCGGPLDYRASQITGVTARDPEQYDYFHCAACGVLFEYRQRTRKLRTVTDAWSWFGQHDAADDGVERVPPTRAKRGRPRGANDGD